MKQGLRVGIKWPNDIIINRKKVSGILTEMSAQADYVNHIVVGIGINVHEDEFPEELHNIATSVFLEVGIKINRAALIERICEYFEAYFELFLRTEDLSGLAKQYDAYMVNRNQQVKVLDAKDSFEGTARGITSRGSFGGYLGRKKAGILRRSVCAGHLWLCVGCTQEMSTRYFR